MSGLYVLYVSMSLWWHPSCSDTCRKEYFFTVDVASKKQTDEGHLAGFHTAFKYFVFFRSYSTLSSANAPSGPTPRKVKPLQNLCQQILHSVTVHYSVTSLFDVILSIIYKPGYVFVCVCERVKGCLLLTLKLASPMIKKYFLTSHADSWFLQN